MSRDGDAEVARMAEVVESLRAEWEAMGVGMNPTRRIVAATCCCGVRLQAPRGGWTPDEADQALDKHDADAHADLSTDEYEAQPPAAFEYLELVHPPAGDETDQEDDE